MRRFRSVKCLLATSTLVAALCMTFTGMARASTIISPGFELYQTTGSFFDFATIPNPQTINFAGNSLGCFDFGDGNGCVSTGPTDLIVERVALGDLGTGSDTIDIEIVALSLRSVALVDLGFGAGFEFLNITLNTSSTSIQSTATLFDTGEGLPHGTFDSVLNFSFDVTGSVGGFYGTIEDTRSSSGSSWQHAPTGATVIDGVNHELDAATEDSDLWLNGAVVRGGILGTSTVPEPGTGLLLGLSIVGLAVVRRSSR